MDQPARILVMAKAPVAGSTKTRLEPLLGPAGCARLQAALLRHTVAVTAAIAPTFVAVAGAPALVEPLLPAGVGLFPQCTGDLGTRMTAAVDHVRTHDHPASRAIRHRESGDSAPRVGRFGPVSRAIRQHGGIVVVGTDCPQLGGEHVAAALDRVSAGDDVVFGPARDGGYYLVALATTTPADAVFALPPDAWGGPQVLALSRAAADRSGLRSGLIGAEHDLDTPEDAALARTDPRVPPTIATLLHPPQAAP